MNGVTIRSAVEEDFPPLCALYCNSIQCNPDGFIQDLDYHGCLIAKTREWRRRGGDMLVAREAKPLIGMGALAPDAEDRAELCKLHVDRWKQGNGIGRLMTEQLIRLAGAKGFSEVILHVTTTQTTAIKLYGSLGFRPVRRTVFETTVFNQPASFDTLYMQLPIR